ncbi:type IV secretion system protein [Pseudoduganella chitinolytica]|uniref:Type IV secretion system protein n=1 Tax=Pseudoduganella chitinolytica TaxID=34070 RepID=A0ABY8BAU6_9BURK|nr:type IV secretion system protein [Pseudoduganella chitinolytica]WEF31464.1 type IV secretion system protein [Pseudoduganella chitinolytica]
MAAPSEFHFYEDMFSDLTDALDTYITSVGTDIIASISGVAYSMLMIYMMLWGWTMMRGMISEPITDGVARIVRLAVIVGLALNLGRYQDYVSDFLWDAPEAMAGIIASGFDDASANVQYLDVLMSRLYDIGNAYWQTAVSSGGWIPDIGMMAVALLVWIAGLAATGFAAFLLALSKMALAVLLALGPIFVLLLIFEGTKKFFEAWLAQALNYVFLIVLTAAAVKLVMTIIETYLDVSAAGIIASPTIDKALPALVFCLISALLMAQLPTMASSLGGGAAISTLGAVGWAYTRAFSSATGALGAMRPTNARKSLNRMKADYRITKGAMRAATGVPGAVYRKITGASRKG